MAADDLAQSGQQIGLHGRAVYLRWLCRASAP
jgi:hypothetical protein